MEMASLAVRSAGYPQPMDQMGPGYVIASNVWIAANLMAHMGEPEGLGFLCRWRHLLCRSE